MDGNRFGAVARPATLAIVGAGFSGTALALALLRDPPPGPCRIVLLERSGRFGRGLAYAGHWPSALLNVPAARMSVDERRPRDFCDYLAARGLPAHDEVFAPRIVYGDYLESRLQQAASAAPARLQFVQLSGTVVDAIAPREAGPWRLRLADNRSFDADFVVLALGHQAPAGPPTLQALAGSGLYVANPWLDAVDGDSKAPRRVLLVGTGLTMADTACVLMESPDPPHEIIAVSRRGLLSRPRSREATASPCTQAELDLRALRLKTTTRGLVAAVRRQVEAAQAEGVGWRAVVAAVREQVPGLWHRLDEVERRRFLRHVRPYWDVHRHQLPPAVGQQVMRYLASGVLRVRAARILGARIERGRALVTLRNRGRETPVDEAFDRVINCSGPDDDLARSTSPLVAALVRRGLLTPCTSGIGARLDAAGRPLGRTGEPAPGLYYLGPWARARDLESTAVQELRTQAQALAELLRNRLIRHATSALDRAQPGAATPSPVPPAAGSSA